MVIFSIIIWIILSVVIGLWNESRGNSFFIGLLLSLLLSPLIGLLIVGVTGKNEKYLNEKAIQSGELKKCLYCAELVKKEAKICKHCGKEFKI